MSRLVATAHHPVNGSSIQIWEGFSWPCFFLGFFWYAVKGLWGWAIVALVLAFSTFGLSWFVFPFFANAQYAKALMERGYLTEVQWQAKAAAIASPVLTGASASSVADALTKLAELKAQGILSEAEFSAQKERLLR